MKCTFCSAELNDDAVFCTECGRAVEVAPAEPAEAVVKADKKPGKGLGIFAMILGIAAFLLPLLSTPCICIPYIGWFAMVAAELIAFICAIVGFILAIVASKKSKVAGQKNVMAKIGLILSIIYLAFWVVTLVIGIIIFLFVAILAILAVLMETVFYF